jgi:DNA-binding NarL/FixJ family response regulator
MRCRVLLVDDNEGILERAAEVLRSDFVIVGAVTHCQAALETAVAVQPDVIVLDISLPDGCGLDVARRLKATDSAVAIVFLTVHDDEEIAREAKDAGGIGYVLKSRLGSELLTAVHRASVGKRFPSGGLGDGPM